MKKVKYFIIFVVLLSLAGCSAYEVNKNENKIIIDKININGEYKIQSKNEKIREIVMFEECGRPNIKNSNVVIGAHSGNTGYAYFNEIDKLEIDDEIILYYNNKKYVYLVEEVKEVKDTEVSVLNNQDKSMLTLLTCKINDSSKRIVVISILENIGKN